MSATPNTEGMIRLCERFPGLHEEVSKALEELPHLSLAAEAIRLLIQRWFAETEDARQRGFLNAQELTAKEAALDRLQADRDAVAAERDSLDRTVEALRSDSAELEQRIVEIDAANAHNATELMNSGSEQARMRAEAQRLAEELTDANEALEQSGELLELERAAHARSVNELAGALYRLTRARTSSTDVPF